MNKFSRFALFALANLAGSFAAPVCFLIGMMTDVISVDHPEIKHVAHEFFTPIYMTWILCALFSTAWFFIKDNSRFFFLLAPVILPFIYGLYSLRSLLG